VQAPTGDGAPQTVAELDARLAALEPVEETYVDVDDVGSIVPREAVAGGAEVVVVRLDRRADTLGGPAARSLVATLADVDRESPAELALFDADGQRLDLSLPPPTDEPTSSTERGSRLLDLAIAVGGVLVVVVLAVGVVLALVRRLRGAPYPDQARGEPDEGPRRAEQTPRPVMGGALRRARDGLDRDADPRLAIISAYWQMEQAMAEAGLPPRPAETSREFLDRCLASIGPGVDAAQRLTELFDWAMFSVHPMTEALRDDASTALLEVIDGLDRPRPAPVVEQ
jgi:hypothetical protein